MLSLRGVRELVHIAGSIVISYYQLFSVNVILTRDWMV